eukprot:1576480-Rhodomonas_salina.1
MDIYIIGVRRVHIYVSSFVTRGRHGGQSQGGDWRRAALEAVAEQAVLSKAQIVIVPPGPSWVSGSRFRVWGLGFGIWDLGLGA